MERVHGQKRGVLRSLRRQLFYARKMALACRRAPFVLANSLHAVEHEGAVSSAGRRPRQGPGAGHRIVGTDSALKDKLALRSAARQGTHCHTESPFYIAAEIATESEAPTLCGLPVNET